MADSVLVAQNLLGCKICMELLKDSVAIPCGHSFCLDCINSCWDRDDQTGVYSCPQCRQTFTPRPVLNNNTTTMLVELAEGLTTAKLQATVPEPGDVECDVCAETKHKAFKSCLVCLMSFCTTHLQPHYESPAYRKHKLVDASVKLQEKICPQHDNLLEVFCHNDQKLICYRCVMDEHRAHDTVSVAAERSEKQKQLLETKREFQQRMQQRQKELRDLCRSVESLRRSAQTAVENSEKVFTGLILSIERKRAEVKEQIRAQEEAELRLAEDLQKTLEQDIADLRKRDTELEQLSHTDDHIHFLQSFQSLSDRPGRTDFSSNWMPISPHLYPEELSRAVSELKKQVEMLEYLLLDQSSGDFGLPPQPKTREDFLKYYSPLSFDQNTAHSRLRMSEGNKKVTVDIELQAYPDHPDRFDVMQQVLSTESLTGRRYWEVKRAVTEASTIAVSYKDIRRKGNGSECRFGCNDQSWGLIYSPSRSKFSFKHNNREKEIPAVSSSQKIGVYVDHSAGILSFYSVSNTMTLLQTVHPTFTKPLYAGVHIYGHHSYAQICDLG